MRRVIVSVYEAIKEEKEYDATRKKYEIEMTKKIKKGTYLHHLLTVLKENNNSFRTATLRLNALTCAVTDEEPVGLTAVYNTIHRCNYEKARTKNVPQTNIKNEIYRQARYNYVPLVGSKPINQLIQQSMKRTTFPVYVVWERKQ